MQALLTTILGLLNYFPGIKTKLGAVLAFLLAILAAWNSAMPDIDPALVWHLPDWISTAVMALIGVGAANQPRNVMPVPPPPQ